MGEGGRESDGRGRKEGEGRRGREGEVEEGRSGREGEGEMEEGEMEEGEMEEGEMEEGWGRRDGWARCHPCPFVVLAIVHAHSCVPVVRSWMVVFVAIILGGRGRQWGSCHPPWALYVRGWVVVICGHSMFMGGVSWLSMEGRP